MSDAAGPSPSAGGPIAPGEFIFRATRSGGPGGQHVNTSATRVELWWHPASSASLSEAQRAIALERLARRLDSEGWLRVVESGTRSQLRNRAAAAARLQQLVTDALRPRKPRRKTRIPRAAKERRLAGKRQRGEIKRRRRPIRDDE